MRKQEVKVVQSQGSRLKLVTKARVHGKEQVSFIESMAWEVEEPTHIRISEKALRS